MTRSRTTRLVRAALVAALIAVGALVAIPIGPVPITLQVLVLATATLVLSPAEAAMALGLYVALGAAGVPVFAGGAGGLGVLAGPTGGFIAGFALGTPAGAYVRGCLSGGRRGRGGAGRAAVADVAALSVFLVTTYCAGLVGFILATGRPAVDALAVAVVPFVLADILKCAVAVVVARAVRAAGHGAA